MEAVKKIVSRFNRQLFDSITSNRLVYNTCWEDPRIDRKLLKLNSSSRVVMLTSAGCNALDYLLDDPAGIFCVDFNPAQNALLELKQALFLNDDYYVLWKFFGEGQFLGVSELYHQSLGALLSAASRTFWDKHLGYFKPSAAASSFYHRGTSGTFASVIIKQFMRKGLYRSARKLLEAKTLAEQQYYFDEIEPNLWSSFIRWLLQQDATMALLGVPKTQRAIIDNETSGGLAAYIHNCVKKVFTERLVQHNYFWRVYLAGSYSRNCCPNYLKEDNFVTIREKIKRIKINTSSLIQFLEKKTGRYTHFVLLDHQDWLAYYRPQKIEQEWRLMLSNAAPGAKILFRSAGKSRSFVPDFIYDHVHFEDAKSTALHAKDRVGTYGSTHLAIVDNPL